MKNFILNYNKILLMFMIIKKLKAHELESYYNLTQMVIDTTITQARINQQPISTEMSKLNKLNKFKNDLITEFLNRIDE